MGWSQLLKRRGRLPRGDGQVQGRGDADEGRQLTKEQGAFKGERPPKREAAADGWGSDVIGGEVCRSAGFKPCRILVIGSTLTVLQHQPPNDHSALACIPY